MRHSPGFTLAELLISVAIVLTVAAIAVPSYMEMMNTAQIARAVSDIKAISAEITVYRLKNSDVPDALAEVGCDQRRDPWGRAYEYLPIMGRDNSGHVRKDHHLVPLNSDYDLYSVGKDGVSFPPITAMGSRDDIVRANNGGFIGLAKTY